MIKFSWKKINNKFGWNAYSVLEYFFIKQNVKIPPYLNRKIPKPVIVAATQPYGSGPCFLINPNKVLELAKYPNDLYLYLELASKRNIFDYRVRGITYLSIALIEEYQKPWIELNPMMKLKNDNIYFKYEQEKQNGY